MRISRNDDSKVTAGLFSLAIASGIYLSPTALFGQNVSQDQDSESTVQIDDVETGRIELPRISVTGYHLKRIDTEGPAPVVVYDRDALDQSGVNSIEDFARYLTQNSQVYTDYSVRLDFAAGAKHFNLRGAGADATLTLIDGMRVAPYGASRGGPFIDINSIPLAAVDRIEILKDGASAIYGAEAITGVVNIILRKHYDGAQATGGFQQTTHGDGTEWAADFLTGFNWGDTRVMLSVSHLDRSPIYNRDRELSSDPDLRRYGGPNGRSVYSSPPSIFRYDTFSFEADPECSLADPNFASIDEFFGGTSCRFNFAQFEQFVFDSERTGAGLLVNHEFESGTSFFTNAIYNINDTFIQAAPTVLFGSPILTTFLGLPLVPANHPDNPLGVRLEIGARVLEAGPRRFNNETSSYRLVTGFEGVSERWDWRLAAMHSASHLRRERLDGVLTTRYQLALLGRGGPDGDLTYNPFGLNPKNDPNVIDWLKINTLYTSDRSESSFDASASTHFGDLPGGQAGVAVGLQWRAQNMEEWADENELSGDVAGSDQTVLVSADRNIMSAFIEFGLPLAQSLELQVAARWEHYSDFGSTTNPKIAMRWQPGETWMLRASWGTSFKPPIFEDLYRPVSLQVIDLIDRQRCDVTNHPLDCRATTYDSEFRGNPDLKPEEGKSRNLGSMWSPQGVPGLDILVDLWALEHSERIIAFSPQFILDLRGDLGITRSPPTDADLAIGAPGRIVQVIQTLGNSDKAETRGFDTSVRYQWTTERQHRFGINFEHTYIGYFGLVDSKLRELLAGRNFAGKVVGSALPRNRANLYFTWGLGDHGASAGLHYQGHYENSLNRFENGEETDQPWTIPSHTTLDLQYTRKWPTFSDATLRLGCQNCLDREPPYTAGIGLYQFDLRGAIIYARWQQPF